MGGWLRRWFSLVERGALKFRPDPLLMQELRSFQWKNGKANTADGEHDDLVMALGMAAMVLPRDYGCSIGVGVPRSL